MPFKKPHHTSDKSYIQQVGETFLIYPKGLNIVWGNDSRYWRILEEGPAELIQVSWLEVSGVVNIQTPKTYKVEFEVKVKQDGFGWEGTDVLVMAKIGKTGKYIYQVTKLKPGDQFTIPANPSLNIQVNSSSSELHFGLYEVWSGKWKGGLQILKAIISPA